VALVYRPAYRYSMARLHVSGHYPPVTAYRTLKGIEAMHALRKGQGRIFAYGHSNPDVVIVEKAFTYA